MSRASEQDRQILRLAVPTFAALVSEPRWSLWSCVPPAELTPRSDRAWRDSGRRPERGFR